MITDIFSAFDPRDFPSTFSVSFPNFYAWIFSLLITPPLLFQIWITPTRLSIILFAPISLIVDQLKKLSGTHLKGFPHITTAIFVIIILLNIVGLTPYVFGTTSHLAVSLSLSLPLWLSLIISGIIYNPKAWIASFLPTGAPYPLVPFLILIEFVSTFVRFITLAVRLTANITAGHTILGILGIYVARSLISTSWILLAVLLVVHIGYIAFEIGVALIQGYIFCLLLSLYSNDHPTFKSPTPAALNFSPFLNKPSSL